jgi:hypothetical protein
LDQLDTPVGKVGATCEEKGVGPLAHNGREGRIDLAARVGVEHLDLKPDSARGRFHVSQRSLGIRGIRRIDKHSHTNRSGYQLTQEFQPLCHQLRRDKIEPCQVAARQGEAGNKTKPDRVVANSEGDGDRCSGRLRRERRRGAFDRDDHGDPPANQFGRQRRQPIELSLGPAVFDRHVLALDVAALLQGLAEYAQKVRVCRVRRCGAEEPNYGYRGLLRAHGKRPRRCRAAEKGDELAPVSRSFDHLVGTSEQRGRDVDAESLRGSEVDNEFNFRGLLNW